MFVFTPLLSPSLFHLFFFLLTQLIINIHILQNNDDTASVKCIYQREARVLRFKKDVTYDDFIRQISQEFGLPLVVDQYVDAEGTLIKLGESSVLDLSAQFNYKTDVRKSLYDLTVYMRSAEQKKNPYDMVKMIGRRNSYGQYVLLLLFYMF